MSGELPGGWTTTTLGEAGTLNTSSVDKLVTPGERTVRLINYMDVYRATHLRHTATFTEVTASEAEIERFSVRRGDLLFTPSSETPDDIGHSAVVAAEFPDTLHSYHTVRWRPHSRTALDEEFAGWFAQSSELFRYFSTRATGSTRYTLTLGDFRDAVVLLPPLPEQKKIAAILSSVDEAIQATQAVIDQTRRVKEGLLQDLLTRGLPGHTRFKQTEIGEIPESWSVERLGSVSTIKSGATPSRGVPEYWGGLIPWVTTGQINYETISTAHEFITETGLARSAASVFPAGTILMAMYGQGATRGRVAMLGLNAATNQACAAFLDLRGVNAGFLYQFLSGNYEALRQMSQEGTQKNLSAALLKEVPLPVPPLSEQLLIASHLGQLDAFSSANKMLLAQLTATRSGLLQDLLTGRVRVSL